MNAEIKQKKTQVGIGLVRQLAAEGERIFSVDRAREVSSLVGLKDSYLGEALYHLRRNGWIVSLRRGLYAIASSIPGIMPLHEFEVAMALVQPAAISHWSAMHHHGLTQQIPQKVFALTTTNTSVPRLRGKGDQQAGDGYPVGGTIFRFVQVKPERYFGTAKVWVGEAQVMVTDAERTLLDGLSMPGLCGDFSEVFHAFEVRGGGLDLERIIEYALSLDGATAKRLGWVLERQGIDPDRLLPLMRVPIKGYRRLDPSGPRKGHCNRRWLIQENLPGKVTA